MYEKLSALTDLHHNFLGDIHSGANMTQSHHRGAQEAGAKYSCQVHR